MNSSTAQNCFIEGYADQLSVPAGRDIAFHISTNAKSYRMEISRVGAERQLVWSKEGLTAGDHPAPANASTHGCGWPAEMKLSVPSVWRSGYYSAILTGQRGGESARSEISFVVRSAHPGRDSKILFQRTTNTDNAYNSWGGSTLYSGPGGPATRVSFDRPYSGFVVDGNYLFRIPERLRHTLDGRIVSFDLRSAFHDDGGIVLSPQTFIQVAQPGRLWYVIHPGATFAARLEDDQINLYDGFTYWESGWRNWEEPFVAWAERAGYQIDYAVNSDLEFHPEMLKHYRLVLSVGHDEYWSSPMRDHLEAFMDDGGNVAFFSANNAMWQVRSEESGRALVCWKDIKKDPLYQNGDHKLLSTMWCNHLINRPENYLTGVSFAYAGYYNFFDKYLDGDGAYEIHRPDHWIFEGTGLRRSDRLGAADKLISYECDGCEFEMKDGLPVPTHRDGTPESFEILATSPAELSIADDSLKLVSEALFGEGTTDLQPQPGAAVMGIFTRGGTVFTTGCTEWAKGLRGGDKAVERITRNILDRLSK